MPSRGQKTPKRKLHPAETKKLYSIVIAFALFFVIVLIPTPGGLSVAGQRGLAIFAFVIILWVTETFPLGLTALIGMVSLALLGVLSPRDAFVGFGSHAIFFLMGGLTLGIAMMKTNLHKRVALKVLSKFGKSPSFLIFGICVLGTFMSMAMPEHAVAALMLPVLLGIASACGAGKGKSNFGIAIFLALAYATSVGSIGTLLGGARNVLAIGILEQTTGQTISFLRWMVAGIPIAVVMMIFTYFLIKLVYPWGTVNIAMAKKHLEHEVSLLGKMSNGEKKAAAIILLCFALWVTVGTTIGLATVAVLGMVLLVTTRTITWKDVERNMPWGMLFLYGGAITLSLALVQTGAVAFLAGGLTDFVGASPLLVIFIMLVLSVYLSQTISNSAATAVILPIALAMLMGLGFSLLVPTYLVAMGSAMAFMLPIASPNVLIAHSSGYIRTKDLIKAGFWLSLVGIATFMTIGLGWWKLLGIW